MNAGIHADLSPIKFDYKDSPLSPLRVVNNGHTIKVDYKSGSHMTVEGQANSEIEKIWSLIPKDGETAKNTMGQAISAEKLLAERIARYQYHGSLTTPPCTEGVLWLVLDEPIHLSSSQIGTFRNLFHANARPVQECNSRFILTSK